MNTLKIILAVLLFLCILNMPYGYYQFVRFAAFAGLSYFAYQANQNENKTEAFLYLALALLFQPFFKIALGRTIWNVVDVVVGVSLIISLFYTKNKELK